MKKQKLLKQGSVKNIYSTNLKGRYAFEFSNRFSVFDWGAMPDQLEKKGEAMAITTNFLFEFLKHPENWQNWNPTCNINNDELLNKLKTEGLTHHGIGWGGELVNDSMKNCYFVSSVDVIKPKFLDNKVSPYWDYSEYAKSPTNALVPLEAVFRFGVPKGSSLIRRLKKDEKYQKELGLKTLPKEGDIFDYPLIEFSTKLEESDRYLTPEQAKEIAHLTDNEYKKLHDLTALVALRLKDLFLNYKITLWDGKFEWAFIDGDSGRDFKMVDSIGLDELRLTYKGVQLSKENLRHFYRKTSWYNAVELAKKEAQEKGHANWRELCKENPPKLSEDLQEGTSMMYKSLAHLLARGRSPFNNVWDLDKIVEVMKKWS